MAYVPSGSLKTYGKIWNEKWLCYFIPCSHSWRQYIISVNKSFPIFRVPILKGITGNESFYVFHSLILKRKTGNNDLLSVFRFWKSNKSQNQKMKSRKLLVNWYEILWSWMGTGYEDNSDIFIPYFAVGRFNELEGTVCRQNTSDLILRPL